MTFSRIMIAIKPLQRGLPLSSNHARQLARSDRSAQLKLVSNVYDAAIAAGCERGDAAAKKKYDRIVSATRVDLERLASSMRDWGANVTTRIVWGAPAYEAILAAAREWQADLLVVGAHEGAKLKPRLTDTDWQLMRHSRCPLLLVKSPVFNGYRTVVAAVDPLHAHDEPEGLDRAVLAAGRTVARASQSTLRSVYAYPGPAAFALASAVQVAPGILYGTEHVADVHRRAVNELAAEYGIGPNEVDLVEGAPADAIVDVATRCHADLVVVGVAQRHGLAAAVIGYTAEHVTAALACDVLLVPTAQRAPAASERVSEVW